MSARERLATVQRAIRAHGANAQGALTQDLSRFLNKGEQAAVARGIKAAKAFVSKGKIDELFGWQRDALRTVVLWDRHYEDFDVWGGPTFKAAMFAAEQVDPYEGRYEESALLLSKLFQLGFVAELQGVYAAENAKYLQIALSRRGRGERELGDGETRFEDVLDKHSVFRNNGRRGSARRRLVVGSGRHAPPPRQIQHEPPHHLHALRHDRVAEGLEAFGAVLVGFGPEPRDRARRALLPGLDEAQILVHPFGAPIRSSTQSGFRGPAPVFPSAERWLLPPPRVASETTGVGHCFPSARATAVASPSPDFLVCPLRA